jgi:hypothetical protein
MNADQLVDTLLSMEQEYLRGQILTSLCQWERVRDYRDLNNALAMVHELVSAEDLPQVS